MATAEKRVITDATGQEIVTELKKIPGVMNPLPVEKGGTGVTTPEEILELIGAEPKMDFDVKEELKGVVRSVNSETPDENGDVRIIRVASADNLVSDDAHIISSTFIERTTGGDASISDGSSNVGILYGNSFRAGYEPEEKSYRVVLANREDDAVPIEAEMDWDVYRSAVGNVNANKTFAYASSWNENPATYGLAITGTPVSGDSIQVYFTAEKRGTITNATPTKLVETNWNLFDASKGYARVLRYSEHYGFKIGGTYTGVSFSTTVDGEKTVLTPDGNGKFDVPSDGYVFVTGSSASDTYILMTWSDWQDGYSGSFVAYSEDVLDISSLMSANFPFGLCRIGTVMDEINFSDKVAYSRIERIAYSDAELAIVAASGRQYIYDTDWIYAVKETPDRISFDMDNQLDVYDHGMEYFTDTVVPVMVYQLFGQNLRDKLRTDVVTISEQSLSNAQKQQVRDNIGTIAPVLVLSTNTFSELPQSISSNQIKSNMVVLQSTLSNPSAQISDWQVETFNGSLTITGSISGSTNVTLYLLESR